MWDKKKGHMKVDHGVAFTNSSTERANEVRVDVVATYPNPCHWCETKFSNRKEFDRHVKSGCFKDGNFNSECRCSPNRHPEVTIHELNVCWASKRRLLPGCDIRKSIGPGYHQDDGGDGDDGDRRRPLPPCPENRGAGWVTENTTGGASGHEGTATGNSENDSDTSPPITNAAFPLDKLVHDFRASQTQQDILPVRASRRPISAARPGAAAFTRALIQSLQSIRTLGRGGFGDVDEVVCKWNSTSTTYARKRISLSKTTGISAELEVLRNLNHRHIVKLADSLRTSDQLWIFMTPVASSDLASYLRASTRPSDFWSERKLLQKWERCMASAVEYLHGRDIRHGDIKPSNILISSDQNVYVADFGSVQTAHMQITAQTPKYSAPETYSYNVRSKAADIFSLGCCWAEMETVGTGLSVQDFETFRSAGSADNSFRSNLQRSQQWMDLLGAIQQLWPKSGFDLQSSCISITKRMLSYDPLQRPSAAYLSVELHCVCERAPTFHSRHSLGMPGVNSPDQQAESSIRDLKYISHIQWDIPIWKAAYTILAAPIFLSGLKSDCDFFYRFSKTYLVGGGQCEVVHIRGYDDEAEVPSNLRICRDTFANESL
jgi:serine/threonine protein kinase